MDENQAPATTPQPQGSNKTMLMVALFVVIALAVLGGVFLMNQQNSGQANQQTAQASPTPGEAMTETSPTEAATDGEEKTFDVESSSFKFNPTTITVNEGDTVTINLKNTQGMHDWVVDEFEGARTKVLQAGESDTITFVADKAGTYEFYCSVGNHRQMGMVGKLIVQ